jgi:hypothetical protein
MSALPWSHRTSGCWLRDGRLQLAADDGGVMAQRAGEIGGTRQVRPLTGMTGGCLVASGRRGDEGIDGGGARPEVRTICLIPSRISRMTTRRRSWTRRPVPGRSLRSYFVSELSFCSLPAFQFTTESPKPVGGFGFM